MSKLDYTALARELFEKLDSARESLGGTLPRSTAIATVASFLGDKKLTVSKSTKPKFADMTDQEFLEYLINTYTWLDVDKELKKCSAWARVNIQNSKGPTRKRIINWMNKADSKPMSDMQRRNAGQPILPIPEPDMWREVVKREFSENSLWYQLVDENVQWSTMGRDMQISIATYMDRQRKS